MRTRVAVGTAVGTAIVFTLFVQSYVSHEADQVVNTWFGMRSDGRCGLEYADESGVHPRCGRGTCCSSHGWCGAGEEYCSVELGCQNTCWEAKPHKSAGGGGEVDEHDDEADGNPHDEDGEHHYLNRYGEDEDWSRRYGRYRGHDYEGDHRYDDHYDAHEEDEEGDTPH